jgi:hypothetical protein
VDVDDYLKTVLDRLEGQYHAMARAVESPTARVISTRQARGVWFRHARHSDTLLCFLKGIKLVSTLNASLLLVQQGYVQEAGALFRIATDCFTDILFFLMPLDGDDISKDQDRFFDEFFQEEFDDPSDPLGSNQKRDSVSRRKIFAGFGQLVQAHLNPSDAQSVMSLTHKVFSGYIHGAYPHIMELYGGNPPRFHMSGMTGTPKQAESLKQLLDQLYRAIMVSELLARKLCCDDVRRAIRELLVEYEMHFSLKPALDPEALVRNAKKK